MKNLFLAVAFFGVALKPVISQDVNVIPQGGWVSSLDMDAVAQAASGSANLSDDLDGVTVSMSPIAFTVTVESDSTNITEFVLSYVKKKKAITTDDLVNDKFIDIEMLVLFAKHKYRPFHDWEVCHGIIEGESRLNVAVQKIEAGGTLAQRSIIEMISKWGGLGRFGDHYSSSKLYHISVFGETWEKITGQVFDGRLITAR